MTSGARAPGLFLALALVAQGCAGEPLQAYKPYRERTQTQTQGDITVTVAVPTAAEAKEIYGVDLAAKQMQPVWVEVRNGAAKPYWFLSSGLDPQYFSSSEAAFAFHEADAGGADRALDEQFGALQFKNPVPPATTASGFVVTNLDEGPKAVDVDLVSRQDARSFTFIASDPTFRGDFRRVDFANLYAKGAIVETQTEDELRAALEKLPCCTTNKDGTEDGDPLNLVLVGRMSDIFPALIRRHWHATEAMSSASVWRTIVSFMEGSRYRYSPISPLYALGRQQDIGAQKARGTIHQRNHMRFWMSPIRYQGNAVWIGQISRDIGVKYTLKSPTISTHVIDPDVDEARRYLIEDVAYSQALQSVGFIKGVGAASPEQPRFNLVGDPWYSDGLRAVLFFGPRPASLGDIQIMSWDFPPPPDLAAGKRPDFDASALRVRAETATVDNIRVRAALPTEEESRAIFGLDLGDKDVQAVWVEIVNESNRSFWLLPSGIDPEYFAPLEVAFAHHRMFSGEANAALDRRLQALNFTVRTPIRPGTTASGFIFASQPRPARALDLDLVGHQWNRSFSLIIAAPGGEERRERLARPPGQDATPVHVPPGDERRLRELVEALPCCATSRPGAGTGLPLNLVLIGDLNEWGPAFVRRGYGVDEASPLYAFGRAQDIAGEKRGIWVAAQPQTVRIWRTPIVYGGKPVWVAQASAPLGGRFANAAAGAMVPRTAPQVDDARNALIQDLVYAQAVTTFGFADGAGRVAPDAKRRLPDGSSYHTDGLRAVMVFDRRPVALSEIHFFDWSRR